MLRNILLVVEYDGTNYFGWQIQRLKKISNRKGGRIRQLETVQGKLEEALTKLFGEKVRISYASRTDRGVHAKGQVVNFFVETKIASKNIKNALNSFLPSDIWIKKVKNVSLDFHARFQATSKLYRYVIINKDGRDVFWRNYAYLVKEKLDIKKMEKAGKYLIGRKDFSLFAKEAYRYKSCLRDLQELKIKKRGSFIYIEIKANGFLRNMVRNIVSFLIAVGRGEINLSEARSILAGKIPYLKKPAPPQGLYLLKVEYGKQPHL